MSDFQPNEPQRNSFPPVQPNFSSGQFYQPPPPVPPQKSRNEVSIVNRTAMWVLLSTLAGVATPACLCVCLCFVSFAGLTAWAEQLGAETETGPAVGVINLSGPIVGGNNSFSASPGYITTQLEWMEENSDVRAIVIRANSPGGGVDPSDTIWHEVAEFRSRTNKPIIVSVQGLCASGCLYISSAADEIWATRSSLVGSIGVISTFFNAQELLDDLGIEVQIVATGENKDFGSFFRPMTAEEEAFWRSQSEILLDNFIQAVASRPGSQLTVADVEELATGRVWVATEAQTLGLVDEIGYEEDAIKRAADLAGMGSYRVQEYPFDFGFLQFFSASSEAIGGLSEGYFDPPTTQELLDSFQQAPLQYRYFGPYENPQSNRPMGIDR